MLLSQFETNKRAHFVFVKKYSCSICMLNCPDDCKNDSDTYHALPPNPPPPPVHSRQKSQMPTFLIIMLCVLGAALVFLTYLTVLGKKRGFSTSRRRNFGSHDASPEDLIDPNDGPVVHPIWYINTVGLQQSVINSIAVFKYKKDERLIEGSDCSVCLSEFRDDETLRLLPKCDHAFHVHCIDTWLTTHKNCPLCRAPIVKESIGDVADEMNTEESVSREDSVENVAQIEGNDVWRNGIDHMAIGVENISSMPNHDGKLQEMSKSSKNEAIRVLSDLAGRFVRAEEELQPMRRSVSMDCFSASRVDASVAQFHEEGCSKIQDFDVTKQNCEEEGKTEDGNSSMDGRRKSYSFRLSLQKVPVYMKRSFSSGEKLSLPRRHRRNQECLEISDLESKASSSGPFT